MEIENALEVPDLGRLRDGMPTVLHSLGDLHGWAPSLINYLIFHKLAEISINGINLGENGKIDENEMKNLFGLERDEPHSGLYGLPNHEDSINGEGHSRIKARWIASDEVGFVQIGDVFDRADHSEIGAEILRQLIIDAPNRVFVLVGNHEQFMLENDFETWYLNESRNAIFDRDDYPKLSSRKHTRFLPDGTFDSEQRAKQLIFPCYKLSTYLLYLTQAAAHHKSGFIKRDIDENMVDNLLSKGWNSYEYVDKLLQENQFEVGEIIHGAMVALVIGDNLFHHSEPGKHLNKLPELMLFNDDDDWFGWFDYKIGGSIQNSEYSEFLWTRGASNGARNGTPKVANEISELRKKWPGLHKIIHGHTPTVGIEEFQSSNSHGIASITFSYLAENDSGKKEIGAASEIRVYNIDEGTSPVYFNGGADFDSPCRVPIGLRNSNGNSKVEPLGKEDPFLTFKENRRVMKDTRKLWEWKKGEFKILGKTIDSILEDGLQSLDDKVSFIREFDDSFWIINTNKSGFELFSTRTSSFNILENIIRKVINNADDINWKEPQSIPNLMKSVSFPNSEILSGFKFDKLYEEYYEIMNAVNFTALGIRFIRETEKIELITLNGTNLNDDTWKLFKSGRKKPGTEPLDIGISSVQIKKHGKDPWLIYLDNEYPEESINYFQGKDIEPKIKQYLEQTESVLYFPTKKRWIKNIKMKNQGLKPDMVQRKNSGKGDKSGQKENPARNEKEEEGRILGFVDKASEKFGAAVSAILPSSDGEKNTPITNQRVITVQEQQQQQQQRNRRASHNQKNKETMRKQRENMSNPHAEKTGIKKTNPDQSSNRSNTGTDSNSESKLTAEEIQKSRLELGKQDKFRPRWVEIEEGKMYLKLLQLKRSTTIPEIKIEIEGDAISSENNKDYRIRFRQGTNTMFWNTKDNGRPKWKQKACGISGDDVDKLMKKPEFMSDLKKWGIIDES